MLAVDRLCCLRGVSTLTGFALAVEIDGCAPLDGLCIGAYLCGLIPSESSSDASWALGGITRTSNRIFAKVRLRDRIQGIILAHQLELPLSPAISQISFNSRRLRLSKTPPVPSLLPVL